jgi:hypothetical protein
MKVEALAVVSAVVLAALCPLLRRAPQAKGDLLMIRPRTALIGGIIAFLKGVWGIPLD